jgi:hypothetical protein
MAVFLGLLVGTGWLLIDGTRGANIANVLGLLVGVLSLLMTARAVRGGTSSTESSPETGTAPGTPSGANAGWTGGLVVALAVVSGLLFTILFERTWWSGTSQAPGAMLGPSVAPATPPATSAVAATPAAPLPPQVSTPAVGAPIGSPPLPWRTDPRQPGINPPPDHRFGGPGPMPSPPHQPPPAQTDFGPSGPGISCSPFTSPAVLVRAIAATDGNPGIATHNFIDLDVLRATRPGYTYWIIAHLIGTNGDASPYIAKQQVRSNPGIENDALQLDADINSVWEIYIVEADPGGTEQLRQNNQLPMDGSQDNQPVRANPPPAQTVSVTCRVTKTRD